MKYKFLLVVTGFAVPSFASEPRLSLRDLIREALRNNPEVIAAQKGYEAARQRPTQESSLPDPTVRQHIRSAGTIGLCAGMVAASTNKLSEAQEPGMSTEP